MKKLLLSLLVITAFFATSCKKSSSDETTGVSDPFTQTTTSITQTIASVVTPIPVVALSGTLRENLTLSASTKYLLRGFVRVENGATLTIPAGTKIFGEFLSRGTLIIQRGGRLIADGTVANPIVFTSAASPGQRGPGNWGGVVICGRAPINLPGSSAELEGGYGATFGGTDAADNSGILRYVRIEYAGIALQPNQEINGLTMGGVGTGTVIENVQVSFSGDDAFEWFGGTVNCKNLIAIGTTDDDFDTDNGYSGRVQYALVLRDRTIADGSGSHAFESDNDAGGTAATPQTSCVFSNVSAFGPIASGSTIFDPNFARGAHIRRNTGISIINSIIAGWPNGVFLDGSSVRASAIGGTVLRLRNTTIAGTRNAVVNQTTTTTGSGDVITNSVNYVASSITATDFDPFAWWDQGAYSNSRLPNTSDLGYSNSGNANNPFNIAGTANASSNLLPPAATHPLTAGVSFTGFTGLETTPTFRGAFGTTDWTATWANFNPANTNYAL